MTLTDLKWQFRIVVLVAPFEFSVENNEAVKRLGS